MVKLKEISDITGYTVSTVSRALKNSSDINPETRLSIQKAARSLGYRSKNRASESNFIGVILPEVNSSYYAYMLHVIDECVRKEGYSVILAITGFCGVTMIIQTIRMMLYQGVKGIFCARNISQESDHDNYMQELCDVSIPIVFTSDGKSSPHFDYIETDNYTSVEVALDHLIGLGHTRFGYVGEVLSNVRRMAFETVLEKRGIAVDSKLIKVGYSRYEQGGFEQMNALLDESEHPTAVLASYDHIAIGAMRAAHLRGLRIPDDVSIVGIDSIQLSAFLTPPLTTVSHPVNDMGAIATELLFDKIENPKNKLIKHVTLQPSLLIRESTAPPKTTGKRG